MKKYCMLLILSYGLLHGAVPLPEVKTKDCPLIEMAQKLGVLNEDGKLKSGLFSVQQHHYKELDEIIQSTEETAQLEEEAKQQIATQAREISQTLKLWDASGKLLDEETSAAYQNILYNTLTSDNSWINQLEIQAACNVARIFLQCENLKDVAAGPLILLATELAMKGHCLAEFLPLCLQELDGDDEIIHRVATELMSQFVSNNIGIEELVHITQAAKKNPDYSLQKKALIAYYFLSLKEEYRAEAIETCLEGIKSNNDEIEMQASMIFIYLILKKIPLSLDIASILISHENDGFRALFAAQGHYLDVCFDMLSTKQNKARHGLKAVVSRSSLIH